MMKLLFVVNTDQFFISHRLPIAIAAQKAGYTVHLACALTSEIDKLLTANIEVHPINLSRSKIGILSNFKTFLEILLVYWKIKPDIVHLVTIKAVLIGGIASHFAFIPKLVVAISGLGFVYTSKTQYAKISRFIVNILYKIALKHLNQTIIFQNRDDMRAIMKISSLSNKQVRLIKGSGVDLNKFVPRNENEEPLIVLMHSRLLIDKGVREYVEAAKEIRKLDASPRFILAGSLDPANPASISPEELNQWVTNKFIEYWGHCSDMHHIIPKCAIVVLPSYREGMPKSLMEAAACGRPIVTTDAAGCRDAIINGKTGLIVPIKDPLSLQRAILLLLKDKKKREIFGRAARVLAVEQFDINIVIKEHLAIYSS